MSEHILFLTGKLAEKRLRAVLEGMPERPFSYTVENIGVTVAALMTAGMIARRLQLRDKPGRIMIPGLCRGQLDELVDQLGVEVIRGPDDLKDIPAFFGREGKTPDLSQFRVSIFAEIVDAADLSIEQTLCRARQYAGDGADIIDVGCLPDTAFPHLEDTVRELKNQGFRVSVDSMNVDELLRAGKAGADYLLSLKESTLWVADEVPSVPVLIPEKHPRVDSLYRAMETLAARGKPFIADSILDPIHFGFTESVLRYRELRRRYPDCEIMMGIGNITELTEADTSGINALLFGIISELEINHVLATQVSPHARSAIREADCARRMFFAAWQQQSLPKGIDSALLTTHGRKPFPYSASEIRELAAEIRDPSYRVEVSNEAIHVYNRDGLHSAADPFTLFPKLELLQEDAPHAFYMGVELARAEIALRLGKRYIQDEPLDWGAAAGAAGPGNTDYKSAGHRLKNGAHCKPSGTTLAAAKKRNRKS